MKKDMTSQQASHVLTRRICLSLRARHPDTVCAVQHHAGCHGVWSSSHSAEGAEGQHFGIVTYTVIGTASLKLLHLSLSRVHRLYPQASRLLNHTLSAEPESVDHRTSALATGWGQSQEAQGQACSLPWRAYQSLRLLTKSREQSDYRN